MTSLFMVTPSSIIISFAVMVISPLLNITGPSGLLDVTEEPMITLSPVMFSGPFSV